MRTILCSTISLAPQLLFRYNKSNVLCMLSVTTREHQMVWQVFALAAAGVGALVGKGAQAYGNSVVDETNGRRNKFRSALPGVIEQVKEQRVLLLRRLISYSTLLRASIGQEAITHELDAGKLPQSMRVLFDQLLGEKCLALPAPSDSEVWKFSTAEMGGMRTIASQASGHPILAGGAMAVGLAKNGVSHAFNANSYKNAFEAEAAQIMEEISRVSEGLANQYENIQMDWDMIVIPLLESKGQVKKRNFEILHEFADICELRARELLAQ